jgi:hypothetical protein
MFRIIPVLAVCAVIQPALAQTMYKCQADGKLEYSDRPCANGQLIKVAAPPDITDTRAAVEASRRNRETLIQLEKLRLAQETREERERAAALREQRAQARERRTVEAQRRKCARQRLQQKWAQEDRARLTGPQAEMARIKSRRAAELLAVECPA